MAALSKQQNFAVNTNKSQIYIEDDTTPLSYNYKTDQWSSLEDYAGIGFYNVDSGLNIGLVRVSGNAVDLQQPTSTDVATTATITTGEAAFSDGSRRTITGVRPLVVEADANVSIIYRPSLNATSRTNYILRSEDFDTTWTKNNSTINTNVVQAPDGETTADELEGDGTAGLISVAQTSQNFGLGTTVSGSCYVKDNDHGYMRLQLGSCYISVDLSDGSIIDTQLSAGFQTVTNYGVETAANSYFRPWLVVADATAGTKVINMVLIDSDGSLSDSVTTGVYLWGAMVCNETIIGEYIPTVASAVSSNVSTSTESTVNSRSGLAPFRVDSRYHRIKFRVSGGFDTILGADVEFVQTGRT